MSDTVVAARTGGTVVSAEPVIEIRNVHKAFGTLKLLDDASLTIRKGETLAIIGESGCGKSVLLKIAMGLMDADGGEVFFKGRPVSTTRAEDLAELRQKAGYVFQADALFDSMTVLDNIGYGMREHTKASDQEIRDRATACLEFVGLEAWRLDLFPAELSGGQRKRVGIARAVAMRPEVLLYDEPTQGLDPQSITRIANLISRLQRELDATSIVVTHDMRTAFTVANRIALLHEGHFEHVGTPAQFAHSNAEPVREFIEDALEELEDLDVIGGTEPDLR